MTIIWDRCSILFHKHVNVIIKPVMLTDRNTNEYYSLCILSGLITTVGYGMSLMLSTLKTNLRNFQLAKSVPEGCPASTPLRNAA